MKIKVAVFLLVFLCKISSAQVVKYASPVNFPIVLAGNVGEIRSDHFHTGIDIKASQGVGSVVKAAADGHVSRIGVSPNGYGKVLYITHLDGTISVYAHLDGFASNISDWVRDQQYNKKSYRVDLYPSASLFAVKQGQTIGFLGNSGSSGGPHLHFEIRDAASNPINVVSNGAFKVNDKVAPNIYRIMLYQCDTVGGAPTYSLAQSIDIKPNKAGQWELSDTIMMISQPSYITYEVIDYHDSHSNTMGIYSISQKVAGKVNFSFKLDRISFATTRYVNTLIQCGLADQSKHHFIRAYVSPNNALSIYRNIVNRGIIQVPKIGEKIEIETSIDDESENNSTVSFWLQGAPKHTAPTQSINTKKVEWNCEFRYEDSSMSVFIPQKALYETSLIEFSNDGTFVTAGSNSSPLQKAITLKIKQLIPQKYQSKALLVTEKNISAGGKWKLDGVVAQIRTMGKFRIALDTICPTIKSYKMGEGDTLKFKIEDDLSGIKSYQLLINDKWELAEFDAKRGILTHQFKRNSVPTSHTIVLTVSDYKGNTTISNKNIEKW